MSNKCFDAAACRADDLMAQIDSLCQQLAYRESEVAQERCDNISSTAIIHTLNERIAELETQLEERELESFRVHRSAPMTYNMTQQEILKLRKLHQEYRNMIRDLGGCDHSVGICACGDYRLLEETEDILRKLEGKSLICPDCGQEYEPLPTHRGCVADLDK